MLADNSLRQINESVASMEQGGARAYSAPTSSIQLHSSRLVADLVEMGELIRLHSPVKLTILGA